jgi:recombination protein RecT
MNYKPAKQAQNNAPAISQSNTLVDTIKKSQKEIARALPNNMDPDRMVRMLITEVRKTPKLAECTTSSFMAAALQSSQLGLEPGSDLGHCYLIPRLNRKKGVHEVHFIIGYQGWIELVERDGRITIEAHPIYANDEFEFHLGINPSITHKPAWDTARGDVIGAYAVARYKDGRYKFRVINKDDIEAARKNSDSGESAYSPWTKQYAEMAAKTAIRRLCKMLPKSTVMAKAQEIEDKLDMGEDQNFTNIEGVTLEISEGLDVQTSELGPIEVN